MDKNHQVKRGFLAGFVSAICLFAVRDIFAVGMKVQAYLCDNYKIEVDGLEIEVPYGMRILNYVDRTYTPARLIAEAMGGTVEWDETNKAIKITKPKPRVIEKIVEKTIEVPQKTIKNHQTLPVKLNKKDFILEITGISTRDNLTYVYIDAENNSGEAVDVLYDMAKIQDLDNIYSANVMSSKDWGDSMQTDEKRKGKYMVFEKISDGTEEITLTIPVKSMLGDSFNETFEYNIKLD